MPDYIYLLEKRLSQNQQNALRQVCQAARDAGMTVFLVGGAVRDLTSGSSVRDLDIAVQGNALKLKKPLEKTGATLWGEHEDIHTLFFRFPVGVRVEISSTRREEYPKPGKPVYHWGSILEDLRRRDFTANAMALSLNERSYGLLMDPLNGVADIEARLLRLVSSYGFLEAPERLLRATRLAARLSWELEERTKIRFQNAKEEGAIGALSDYQRGYELEEIGHEEDGLRTLAAMEAEGWMQYLDPAWTSAKADAAGLEEMHQLLTRLQMQGVNPDPSAASMHFLTAKLRPAELASLKKMFVRPGFVKEWNDLDAIAKEFGKQLTGKAAATPSSTWTLFTSADPQAVLWLGLTTKSAPIQAKYQNFFTVWPAARQKVPYALMQELRITPEIAGYDEMLNQLFFRIIDGKLETEEQLRAFLEPYSPPAPPPPVTVRRGRGSRKGSELKAKLADDLDLDDGEIDHDHDHDHDHDEDVLDQDALDQDAPEEEIKPEAAPVPAPAKKSAAAAKKAGPEVKAQSPAKPAAAETKEAPAPKRGATPPPAPAAVAKQAHKAAPAESVVKTGNANQRAPKPGKPHAPSVAAKKPLATKKSTGTKTAPHAAPSHAIQGKAAHRSAVKPGAREQAASKKSKSGSLTPKSSSGAQKKAHKKSVPLKKSSAKKLVKKRK